jgi:glycosyltransferase involved in cell wall biosynthesis
MSAISETIKVANIIEDGRYAGAQNRMAGVAERLKPMGIETVVILPEKDNSVFVERLQAMGTSYLTLPLHRMARTPKDLIKFFLSFPADVLKMRKAIKESGAQLVHCNGSWQWKGVVAGKMLGLSVVWHLNDTSMPNSIRRIFNLIAKAGANAFIVAAKRVETYYLGNKFSSRPRFLVLAPVDCERFAPIENYHRDETDATPLNIVSVGNVNPTKDVGNYVRMAKRVNEQTACAVEYVQVGALFETQKHYICHIHQLNRTEVGEVVSLAGQQTDVLAHLQRADIYVCSSRFEASPISVWEAMAVGLPIVTTDVGDIAAMNEEGDFARVVPTEDPEALAAAVLELIDFPDERFRLGRNARRYALAHLDIDVCVRNHAKVYRTIISQKRSLSKRINCFKPNRREKTRSSISPR